MKYLYSLLLAAVVTGAQAQQRLQKIWESDTTLAIPESVLPDAKKGILYVSLIDGPPWGKDGKGGIGILDMNGKIVNANWATGLDAPKGMGLWKDKLYVADMSDVVVINTANGKIDKRITITGAENLNDLTVDSKGTVYVSDSKNGNVHAIKNGTPASFVTGLTGVNGLKAVNDDVYILTRKEVYKAGQDKQLTKVGEMELGGDGIEPVGDGSFITSSWIGTVYHMAKDGTMHLLLDTREQKRNTADIGYDPVKKIVYVPTFFAKSVVAYQLQ